jgi:hypothetical protein
MGELPVNEALAAALAGLAQAKPGGETYFSLLTVAPDGSGFSMSNLPRSAAIVLIEGHLARLRKEEAEGKPELGGEIGDEPN